MIQFQILSLFSKFFSYISSVKSDTLHGFLFILGLIFIIVKSHKLIQLVLTTVFRQEKNLVNRYGQNTYAVVTGASDGIGKTFCFSLARRGFNIVMIARNINKLAETEKELKEKYPSITTKTIVADFSNSTQEEFFDKIQTELNNSDISILINNVGVGHNDYLTNLSEQQLKELVIVNCIPQAVLSKYCIGRFMNRQKKSCIVSLSSNAASFPRAILQTYGATKTFNDYFSRSIALEYPDIDILSLRPSLVDTNMIKDNKKKAFVIAPEECVEATLRELGHETLTYGHWKHKLLHILVSFVPENVRNYAAAKLSSKKDNKQVKMRSR